MGKYLFSASTPQRFNLQKEGQAMLPSKMTFKDFRHMSQGLQALATAGAVLSVAALAWYAYNAYQRAQHSKTEE
jgi:hypothetical protein